jgi:hypothetical protein
MVERLTRKALLALAFCILLVLPVSTAWAQKGVWEGTKKGVGTAIDKTEDVGEAVGKGIKKGAEVTIDKTEDVGEAVGKGVKNLFTDDDPDSDNDEGLQATEPQRSRSGNTYSNTESNTSLARQNPETAGRELPATAGEQPWLLLIGTLALISAAALKVLRRAPNA